MSDKTSSKFSELTQKITGITPEQITNMNIEEIKKYTKIAREKNRLIPKRVKIPEILRKRIKYSELMARGSMIAANHRFIFSKDIDKKISKLR